jgi:hypothetical protein
MPAAGALVEMTAECSGTTRRNGQQHFAVLPAEPGGFVRNLETCNLQDAP